MPRSRFRANSVADFTLSQHAAATVRGSATRRACGAAWKRGGDRGPPRELRAGLDAFLQHPPHTHPFGFAGKVAFVFPGQGGQYVGMARQLLADEPVFRQAVEACADACRAHGEWSVLELLARGEGWETEIDRVQPALFAVQVGLAALWASWGIRPDAVIGHSMGEVAAAYVAGMVSLPHAAQIICRRSALLTAIRGRGGMLLVELSLPEALAVLRQWPDVVAPARAADDGGSRRDGGVGDSGGGTGAHGRLLPAGAVDVASHSRQVEPLAPQLSEALAGVTGAAGTIPILDGDGDLVTARPATAVTGCAPARAVQFGRRSRRWWATGIGCSWS